MLPIDVETATKADEYHSKHLRWNYVFNFIDGAAFWLGYSFIAPGVILPLFVSHFTESKILIGAIAMISTGGWFLPQLFTSNWIEQVSVKRNVTVRLGFLTERVPILLLPIAAALSLISPGVALVSFYLLFAWHVFGSGVVAVAWQDMIAKIIPLNRRGLFVGVTTLGGNATGVVGALIAARLLDAYAFPMGYTINFIIAAVLILLSWAALALVREFPVKNPNPPKSNREYFRSLPRILKLDTNFRWFLFSQVLYSLAGMSWGFLAVYTSQRFALSDGETGMFFIWTLVGQSIGNLLGGIAGDRFGYKKVMVGGVLIGVVTLGITPWISSSNWMILVFLLRGLNMGLAWLASFIVLEFGKPEIRPTYIGVNNSLTGLTAMVAPLLGGVIAEAIGYRWLFGFSAVIGTFSLLAFIWMVRDPRRYNPVQTSLDVDNTPQ